MKNNSRMKNVVLAMVLVGLTLGVLAVLRQWGGIEAEIESGWLKVSGALAGFVVVYECLRRTVFGKQ